PGCVFEDGAVVVAGQVGRVDVVHVVARTLTGRRVLLAGLKDSALGHDRLRAVGGAGPTAAVDAVVGDVHRCLAVVGDLDEVPRGEPAALGVAVLLTAVGDLTDQDR